MRKDQTLALALAWLVPGLGHLYVGKPRKALFFFVTLTLLYVVGYVLADFRFVRLDDNPFYYVGRWGSGVVLLSTQFAIDHAPRHSMPLDFWEPGLLYMCASGLLNLVLVFNVLNGLDRRAEEEKAAETRDSSAPAGPAA